MNTDAGPSLPLGQVLTQKWPVLTYGATPKVDPAPGRSGVTGWSTRKDRGHRKTSSRFTRAGHISPHRYIATGRPGTPLAATQLGVSVAQLAWSKAKGPTLRRDDHDHSWERNEHGTSIPS